MRVSDAMGVFIVVPSSTGSSGEEKAALVVARNEVKPLQDRLLAINELARKEEVVRFEPYQLDAGPPG